MFESFRFQSQRRLLALEALSIAITSYGKGKWPLVTVPDFAVRGWTARQEMGSETIGFLPLVSKSSRQEWETYSLSHQGWIQEARDWEKLQGGNVSSEFRYLREYRSHEIAKQASNLRSKNMKVNPPLSILLDRQLLQEADFSQGISSKIYTIASNGVPVVDEGSGPYLPIWQTSPTPSKLTTINYNLLSHPIFWKAIDTSIESKQAIFSEALNLKASSDSFTGTAEDYARDPISVLYYPVFDQFSANRTVVGMLATEMVWTYFFEGVLPDSARGIICVVENACNQQFSFQINGQNARYLGAGDLHNPSFDHMGESQTIAYLTEVKDGFSGNRIDYEHCPFTLSIYPSALTQQDFHSKGPALYTSMVVTLFAITVLILYTYDKIKRNRHGGFGKSFAALERIFPQDEVRPSIGKRVMNKLKKYKRKRNGLGKAASMPHFHAAFSALPHGKGADKIKTDPFSNATVMFADITGLEAWGSDKDPEERATLLETVHRTLNVVAKRHGVFQVEMAGDCFVAVTGVQDAEDDHAVKMACFVSDSRKRTNELFKNMQVKGLSVRFGIHSGHVQAGMYEEDNSRFQLFGETVDTTYQMLTSGKPNKIHVSVETAELLNLAGRSDWITARKDLVLVKGKGEMSTFWIKPKKCLATMDAFKSDASTVSETTCDSTGSWGDASVDSRRKAGANDFESLVEINFSILLGYLKHIQACRNTTWKSFSKKGNCPEEDLGMGDPIIEEAQEIVQIPGFDARSVRSRKMDQEVIDLGEEVETQLRLYISSIASTYRDNPFHCFEHATHTTIAMDRMLKKIAAPEESNPDEEPDAKPKSEKTVALELHNRTFGIASDPVSQFALVFSALVHDVDHVGVTNYQLIKEKSPIAGLYKNKSVAEQNSVDIAWWLLLTPNFSALRRCIYSDGHELRRFRQILVNAVIHTDILDRDLKALLDRRWAKAFRKGSNESVSAASTNLRATLVVEYLMQAADVAHTIQNFHVYKQWNERQFEEMYRAYHAGRADRDPAASWYVGELCFFDNFVIPLASKLRDSGVFGKAGNEYLWHAIENRKHWADQGKYLVRDMVEGFSRNVAAAQEETICFT